MSTGGRVVHHILSSSCTVTDFTAAYVAVEDVDDSKVGHFGTEAGVRKLASRKQHVFHQQSGRGCKKDEARPLVGVRALCSFQCFNSVGEVTSGSSGL